MDTTDQFTQSEQVQEVPQKVYFSKTSTMSKVPLYKTEVSAGLDMFPSKSFVVNAGKTEAVSTGIRVRLPEGCYGRLAARSSLAKNRLISVEGGVIDRDYNGEVIVLLRNHSSEPFAYDITKDTFSICQLIVEKIERPTVEVVDSLPPIDSSRTGGFGSTN